MPNRVKSCCKRVAEVFAESSLLQASMVAEEDSRVSSQQQLKSRFMVLYGVLKPNKLMQVVCQAESAELRVARPPRMRFSRAWVLPARPSAVAITSNAVAIPRSISSSDILGAARRVAWPLA